MNIQSSIPDAPLYTPSQQSGVLGGLRAPAKPQTVPTYSPGADATRSMKASSQAMAGQNQANAGMAMSQANTKNQQQMQAAKSNDFQAQAKLYANQYGDYANRANQYTQLNAQADASRLGFQGDQMAAAANWADRILGGLLY